MSSRKKKQKKKKRKPDLETLCAELPSGFPAQADLRRRKREAKNAAKAIIREHVTARAILEGCVAHAKEEKEVFGNSLVRSLYFDLPLPGLGKVPELYNWYRLIKKELAQVVNQDPLSQLLREKGWKYDGVSITKESKTYNLHITFVPLGPKSDSYSDSGSESS
jgi:hypothetical protein